MPVTTTTQMPTSWVEGQTSSPLHVEEHVLTPKLSAGCRVDSFTWPVQVADSRTVWGLYKEGCTLQVHQPQRFQEDLAGLCSGLEQRLGCLVGINAYLTPPSTQVSLCFTCSLPSSTETHAAAVSCWSCDGLEQRQGHSCIQSNWDVDFSALFCFSCLLQRQHTMMQSSVSSQYHARTLL